MAFPTLNPKAQIRDFFFRQEIPYGLALVRFLLPLALMAVVVHRWPYVREIYSLDGAPAPLADNYGYVAMLPVFPGWLAVALFTLLGAALLSSAVGWCTRTSLAISTVLYPYFGMLDCLGTMTKYTVIATHGLLLLLVSECGAVWSIDAWLAGRWRRSPLPSSPPIAWPKTEIWPQRLMQLMIGIVYFGAAITKIHTPAYFSGDQLTYWMMTQTNSPHPIGEYLTDVPLVAVIAAYVCAVWEIVFLFACWKGVSRHITLWVGVLFHLATYVTLGLVLFPIIMWALYFSFMTEADVQWIGWKYRRFRRHFGLKWLWSGAARTWERPAWLTPAAGGACLAAVMAASISAGVGIERWLDRYGLRRPEGRYTLRALAPEEVRRLFHGDVPIREQDKFMSLDLGTMKVGGYLWNRRSSFKPGEMILIQAGLNPPHGDMWLLCQLRDSENRVLDRVGQIVAREQFRADFGYLLTEAIPPGEYAFVLTSRGQEVARRNFVVEGKAPASAPLAD